MNTSTGIHKFKKQSIFYEPGLKYIYQFRRLFMLTNWNRKRMLASGRVITLERRQSQMHTHMNTIHTHNELKRYLSLTKALIHRVLLVSLERLSPCKVAGTQKNHCSFSFWCVCVVSSSSFDDWFVFYLQRFGAHLDALWELRSFEKFE